MTNKEFGEWALYYFGIGFISGIFFIIFAIAIVNTF
jgi:hypothetical protein